jgi:ABC-2 type transport system permease protein
MVAKLAMLTPMAQIIQDVRHGLVTNQTATITTTFGTTKAYVYPLLIIAIIALTSVVYFKKRAKYFAEDV